MSHNYTLEISAGRDFAFKDRMGFTTANVNDPNIRATYNRAVAAVKSGALKPVEAGSDEFDIIKCFMRVRKSNPENREQATFIREDGEAVVLPEADDDLV